MSHLDENANAPLHRWINDSRSGDEMALNRLAEYLLPKAFSFAGNVMQDLSPMEDHEDVAISAVKSICLRFRQGKSEFLGEKELESLLRQFVIGKIRSRQKYHFAEKRDVNKNTGVANDDSRSELGMQRRAVDGADSIWLDELSVNLPIDEQNYLENVINVLGADVQGLFSELVKRLDERPRKVLMLMTQASMSNMELAEALDCAPTSIERYRRAIRKKLEEIVNK